MINENEKEAHESKGANHIKLCTKPIEIIV